MKSKFLLVVGLIFAQVSLFAQVTNIPSTIPGTNGNFAKRSCIVTDNNNNKWVGFNVGTVSSYQLMRYNGATWDTFPNVPSRKVNAIAVDVSNNIWLGTDSGLVMFNGTVFTKYSMFTSNIASNKVISVACAGGNVYAGTYNGLCVFNGSTFSNYNKSGNGMASDTIWGITVENSNTIWLGNNRGLEKYDGNSTFTFYNVNGNGPAVRVNCIYIDAQSNKWIGTSTKGVRKYDNTSFKTMNQLYGFNGYGLWPSNTQSICRGPNGGVFFTFYNSAGTLAAGAVEAMNVGYYIWVPPNLGYYTGAGGQTFYTNDNITNDIYYVTNIASVTGNLFTYKYTGGPPPPPSPGTITTAAYLDINHVACLIRPVDLHWDLTQSRYYTPQTQNSKPLFASSLWIGGYNNGTLHTSAMTYRQNGTDFWPGPIDSTAGTSDTIVTVTYNQVWKVNRYDVANFVYNWNVGNVQNGTFIPPPSILTWPGNNYWVSPGKLAPYVDLNNNGYYDPINDGDYPLIKGDQMVWRVYNDTNAKFPHTESSGRAFGLQVKASAYAYVCPNPIDSDRVLNYTTFYDFEITNYSAKTYDSCYATAWIDSELGNYLDDYIGCNVMGNYGFSINGDNYDDDANGVTGYHSVLPEFSCNFLKGPPADPGDGVDNNNDGVIDESNEECLMSNFTYYTNSGDPQTGNPWAGMPQEYYNFMSGKWKNGTPITYGGAGTLSSNPACRHLFPGNSDPFGITLGGSISSPVTPPVSNWTETTAGITKGDMRFLMSAGKFTMQPGQTYELEYALVFSEDSTCPANNTCVEARAQQDNDRVRMWYKNNSFPSCATSIGVKENEQKLNVKLYPNPAHDMLHIEFDSFEKGTIEIFDLMGKVVQAGTFMELRKYASLPIDRLAPGVYLVKVNCGGKQTVRKFVKE